jgi:ribulose-5-phosphate 4-epimerase/fuculose-1-phosphate aldolase
VFDDFTGVVLDTEEGKRIAHALSDGKAAILRNHGLLTVGASVDEAAWWFITMERSCQVQLLADAAGDPVAIDDEYAALTRSQVGTSMAGWFSFQPLYDKIVADQPDLLD